MAASEQPPASGELVFCGATDWALIGRSDKKGGPDKEERALKYPNLPGPHRLAVLQGIKINFVASGCASCHCVALDEGGKCYTWGRNENGQLGHGDKILKNVPTVVQGLTKHKVVHAAAGKHHTVVITDEGLSLGFGGNKFGQLGLGHYKNEVEASPEQCLVTSASSVACGADFSVWLSKTAGASILSAGLPQYGQLGHGTDHEYNAKASSVQLMYDPQPTPRPIAALANKEITAVACGNNHSVAVDSTGLVYSWGFGGHGRLGHKEQKDEFTPRQIEVFSRHNLAKGGVVACGSAYSYCTGGGGMMYSWGRVKPTGENIMYPKPFDDLSGWHVRSLDCGNLTSAAAAESSCITWGTASCGELGYGPSGPKSSARAKKVDALEGLHTIKVACGTAHTLMIVDSSKPEDLAKINKLPVFAGEDDIADEPEVEEEEAPSKAGAKRKAGGKAPSGKAGKKASKATEVVAVPKGKKASKEAPQEAAKATTSSKGTKAGKGGKKK